MLLSGLLNKRGMGPVQMKIKASYTKEMKRLLSLEPEALSDAELTIMLAYTYDRASKRPMLKKLGEYRGEARRRWEEDNNAKFA